MTTAATKALIADVNKTLAARRADIRAAAEADVALAEEYARSLIAKYIADDDPEASKAEFTAAHSRRPDGPKWHYGVIALPTGERLNPVTREGVYFDAAQTAVILAKAGSKATRVWTTFGEASDTRIGDVLELQHDQTGARLGAFEVVGVVAFADRAHHIGDIPNRRLAHSVAK